MGQCLEYVLRSHGHGAKLGRHLIETGKFP
jgi:hypothetical protein